MKKLKNRKCYRKVFVEGKCLTEDLGGSSTTEEFTKAIIENL